MSELDPVSKQIVQGYRLARKHGLIIIAVLERVKNESQLFHFVSLDTISTWRCGEGGRLPRAMCPQVSGSDVLDVTQGMGLRAGEKVRYARGTARKSQWCAIEHRVIDWVYRSPSQGVRSSNHDRRCDRRDAGVGPNS
jgi:hypothetical protein